MSINGFGLGLRPDHYQALLRATPAVDWLEAITENYLIPGGQPLHYLDRLRERFNLVLHGVSLSVGCADAPDLQYLAQVRQLADRLQPAWISDHLCWTGIGGVNLHDLLPLPYTEEALRVVVDHIGRVQDALGRQILMENVSSYLQYGESELSEWEFLHEVVQRSDCAILLDVNNVYVSSINHGFDPLTYLRALPSARIRQIHLAGHSHRGDHLIDTHDEPISDAVWSLYGETVKLFGDVPTMIERDDNIPPLEDLVAELDIARRVAGGAQSKVA
jgi:uncharacterized protein